MKTNNYIIKKTLLLLLSTLFIFINEVAYGQGTWTNVTNTAPNGSGGLMLLLSDGTVMAKSNAGGGSGTVWMKLTPDIHGSYINGTWSNLASMINDRLYFSSQVLKDGRVYVAGGEYGNGGSLAEMYNPLNNTWTALPDPGHRISDANSEILPDGKVLQALVESDLRPTIIYDPASNQFTAGPSTNGIHNESAWVKLPDNSILYVDRLSRNSERYIPSQNRWITDANLPVDLYDPYGDETGAAFLLPDSRAFFIGSSGTTAYYTPSGNTNPGSWSAGPGTPSGMGAPDGAAAMMANGKILMVLSPPPTSADHFPAPTYFYEFDYRNNSFTRVNAPDGSGTGNYATFVTNMLNLPDGKIIYSVQGDSRYYIYTPSGAQISAARPVIGQISANNCNGSSYTISGTGFNGISEGAGYGDDWQMATNYPVVRLTNGSNVYYARTYNWNLTGVQTGGAATNAQFTLPAGLPNATYSLVVTANGISSDPVSFTPSSCNSTGLITVYKDCNFGGSSSGLNVGDYTTSQLNALGVLNNDVSSLKVLQGYKVILYDGDNFTGASTVITSDNGCLVAAGWNDITSSIQVRTNGATNMAGVYYLQNRNSGLYMDVWGATNDDGANIAQGGFNGGANQQFQFTHLGDGTYKILATHSMKTVDVSAISTADGANVQQWTYNGSPNQQFILVSTGDGYYKLIPKHSGKVVEVANASTASGANVQQYTNNNQTCGQWGLVVPQPVNGTGDGITANYFNGMNFETPRYSRKDPAINFDWGTGSPNASVNADQFSARWTGQIQPRYSGTYTFYMNSDNGRRLWINNQLIVDKWIDDWGTEYTGTILLNAGQKYEIKLEYFENNGGANCKMEWSSLLQAREVVPQSQLYSNAFPTVSITSPANNASFSAPASMTLNSNAGDADGSVSKVDYYNGTALLASTTSPFSYTWSNVAAGTYAITAIATDNRGAVTISSVITVQVTAPSSVATVYQHCNYDPSGYGIALAVGSYTTAQLTAIGILNNDISSVKVVSGYKVILYDGDNFTGTALTLTADNTCLVTNNFNDIVSSLKVTDVTTNIAPTVSITSPANNASFNAPASIAFNTNASDADGTISKVEFFNGSNLIGTVTASPYNYTWNNVAAGAYAITAKATDNNGAVTVSAAVNVTVTAVSMTIQAEAYSNMSGVATESTSDAGGGLNVGWIDTGDWMAYNTITFPTTGSYLIEYRVASLSGGRLSCDLNAGSIQLGAIDVPATGGWQTWTTISQTVNVNAGTYNFGIFAQTGGWNLNWFRITKQSPASARASQLSSSVDNVMETSFEFYPNPADAALYIRSSQDLTGGQAKVFDGLGIEVISLILDSDAIDVSSLKPGIYTLVVSRYGNKVSRRFMKQ